MIQPIFCEALPIKESLILYLRNVQPMSNQYEKPQYLTVLLFRECVIWVAPWPTAWISKFSAAFNVVFSAFLPDIMDVTHLTTYKKRV